MRSPAMPVTGIHHRFLTRQEALARWWLAWREQITGALLVIGLYWSFLLPSLLPVHWWMILPCAMLAGVLRQQPGERSRAPLIPLWGFFAVLLLFLLYAAVANPLLPYGRQKILTFAILAALAYLSARRQAPLTEEFLRGVRWTLVATVALIIPIVVIFRDLFLKQQEYGIAELNQSVSIVAFPLVIAVVACAFLPKTTKPAAVFLGSALLLAGAVLEVLVRGRFHAITLSVLMVVLLLGPPWRGIFWRVLICGVLAACVAGIVVNVLPLMGDSYKYLIWVDTGSLAGRGPAWEIAWRGFLAQPLGHGIGAYEISGGFFPYPHNVILEVAYELGILGLIGLLGIYAFMLRRVAQLWLSPPHRIFAAMTVLVFLHMLKAGDLSNMAFHWVFLYLLVVCTPLAPTWPLAREKEPT